ncbi:MAG: ribosomal protein S18-alanine N-acetyltransferase [Betaproteobacteria bacterium]|nr:ribosomal protein S18-alanine N-acetyltransferase [Betaproteobacteria bacterium]
MSALPQSAARPGPLELAFRRIRDADLEAVAAIERRVYAFPWTVGNFRDALLSGYRFWGCWRVGVDRDELIGYAILMLAVDEAHLLNIAVDAHCQGRGFGRRMLKFIIDDARAKECAMLFLEVRPSNTVAQALYADVGFTQHGLRKAYYPARQGREDALFLGLEL